MEERTLTEPPGEFLDWVRANAVPITSLEPGRGTGDLAPFRQLIGDARVVTLGEASHGAREFARIKHRLLELCFGELGFTLFGLEAPFTDFVPLRDFVRGEGDGEGDIAATLDIIYHYNTEEFLDIVRWLRERNRAAGGSGVVDLWGWDPSFPVASARSIVEYLERTDPALAAEAAERLSPILTDFNVSTYKFQPWAVQNATAAAISDLAARLAMAPPEVRLRVRLLEQGERVLRALTAHEWLAARSIGGAENIAALMEMDGPDSRMVAWAHNGHCQRAPYCPGVESVAGHLTTTFGDRYVSVGFAFSEGEFRGVDLPTGAVRNFTLPPSPAGTLDAALASIEHPVFALDLRTAPRTGPAHEWLASPAPHRIMTSYWTDIEALQPLVWASWDKPNSLNWVDIRDCFDVLIFVRSVTPHHGINEWTGLFPKPPGPPSPPDDLTFRAGPDGLPVGWSAELGFGPAAFRLDVGDGSLRLHRDTVPSYWAGDGVVRRTFDASPYAGRVVRFSAQVDADGVTGGRDAQVFVRVDRAGAGPMAAPLDFATGADRAQVEVPPDAGTITIGLVLSANGEATFREPAFTVVDRPAG